MAKPNPLPAPPPSPACSPKFDAEKDGRISFAEVASDPLLQRGFENNDLDGDGFLDERDWNFYVARRAAQSVD